MSTLISTITSSKIKARWEEPYTSDAINSMFGLFAKGVMHGFYPVPNGGKTVRFQRSATLLTSLAFAYDPSSGRSLAYVETSPLDLDLSAFSGTAVVIGIVITYVVGSATEGEIRAYTDAEYAAAPTAAVWLCRVNVPAAATPIALVDISLFPRDDNWRVLSDRARAGGGSAVDDPWIWDQFRSWRATIGTGNAYGTVTTTGLLNGGPAALLFALNGASPGDATMYARAVLRVEVDDTIRIKFDAGCGALTADQRGMAVDWISAFGAVLSTSWITPAALTGTIGFATYEGAVKAPATAYFAVVRAGVVNLTAGEMRMNAVYVDVERQNRFELGAVQHARYTPTDGLTVGDVRDLTRGVMVEWGVLNPTRLEVIPFSNGTYDLYLGAVSKTVNLTVTGSAQVFGGITVAGPNVEIDEGGGYIATSQYMRSQDFTTPAVKNRREIVTFERWTEKEWSVSALHMEKQHSTFGAVRWPVLRGGTLQFLYVQIPAPPSGCELKQVVFGVDQVADGALRYSVEIVSIGLASDGPVVLASATNLSRSGPGLLGTVSATLDFILASSVYLLRIEQTAGAESHDIVWIRFEYRSQSLLEHMGLV